VVKYKKTQSEMNRLFRNSSLATIASVLAQFCFFVKVGTNLTKTYIQLVNRKIVF